MAEKTILVCTVGGSHAPIVASIKFHKPTFTYFICSSGKNSSKVQITGSGNCIKANFQDDKPTLPNIPTQAGLEDSQLEVVEVLPDDADAIHECLRQLFDRIASDASVEIITDYTGGTKSMTAALLLAGLEYDNVTLFMVAGQRDNLRQVTDGTETPVRANVERIRFHHKWSVAMAPWNRYGYADSAIALEAMEAPTDAALREQYLAALAASRAFAAWDRFDHGTAYDLLKSQGSSYGNFLSTLSQINRESATTEPLRLLDLRLNMLRKAEKNQFDDAVGRAYRLIEWTGQWLLKRDADIDSGNVPADRIPDSMQLRSDDAGVIKAGLRDTWELLGHYGNDCTKSFAEKDRKHMLQHLTVRNHSILAHGFKPIGESEWISFLDWMKSDFFPLLDEESKVAGIKQLPLQLPQEFEPLAENQR